MRDLAVCCLIFILEVIPVLNEHSGKPHKILR